MILVVKYCLAYLEQEKEDQTISSSPAPLPCVLSWQPGPPGWQADKEEIVAHKKRTRERPQVKMRGIGSSSSSFSCSGDRTGREMPHLH